MISGPDARSGGIYIHIPYCRRKCLYCDFFSGGASAADWGGLVLSLLNELDERAAEIPERVVSIYFGGGTPSAMPPEDFANLAAGIMTRIGSRLSSSPEITMEINPEDVTESNVKTWVSSGVNRASLGIESFNDRLLKSVGRRHSGEQAAQALKTLGFYFSNISADLIFGLPGQTREEFLDDVKNLVSLSPQHISAYSLMYEPGTALTVLRDRGRISPVDEAVSVAMFNDLSDEARKAGYSRYEISNYSRPGFESHHNNLYWRGAPYLGLGPSAHSYDGRSTRRFNPPDIKGYLKRFGSTAEVEEDTKFYGEESLTDEELREEFILTRLRLKEGFSLVDYERRFGGEKRKHLEQRLIPLLERGDVTMSNGNVSLTEEGIMKSDSIILELAF